MKQLAIVVAVAVSVSGCVSEVQVVSSSNAYLKQSESTAHLNKPQSDAALEITRLFETRGYAMLDQVRDPANQALTLKFAKSNRPLAATKDPNVVNSGIDGRDVGSVFYAWLVPDSATTSVITLVGKPTLNGQEPCTSDALRLPCSSITVETYFRDTYMSGRGEADVVHGILSELTVEGLVVASPS